MSLGDPRDGDELQAAQRGLLYIEDDPHNIRLIQHVFARLSDLSVHSATHGRSGIERAREQQPDVILLDMHLPDMTGEEVIVALKEDADTRHIPIVVLSGSDPALRHRALESGASDYVAKPFALADLIATIERVAPAPSPRRPDAEA